MRQITKVTKKEFIDFIKDQPDNRPVNMDDNDASDKCGCVMIHYGKDKGWDFDACGVDDWYGDGIVASLDGFFIDDFDFFNDYSGKETTYGELKKHL